MLVGGGWALWKFGLQREAHAKIEFDLELTVLGQQAGSLLVEVSAKVTNKGLVRHWLRDFRFDLLYLLKDVPIQLGDKRINYQVMPVENLHSMKDFIADAIIAHWCLHSAENKEDILTNLLRLSNNQSYLLINTCERLPNLLQTIEDEIRCNYRIDIQSPFHYLTLDQWQSIVKESGWQIVSSINISIIHKVSAGIEFLNIWFSASAGAAFYKKTIDDLEDRFLTNLIALLDKKFMNDKNSWSFVEDTLFLILRRVDQ